MIASLRRLDYARIISTRQISPDRADPQSQLFDPERAAVHHFRAGRLDEAFWLVFLSTHFGKNLKHGWRMLRDVYSGLGAGTWTWARVSTNPAAFRAWLLANQWHIRGGFGSHRNGRASELTFQAAPPQSWKVMSPGWAPPIPTLR
jgi:hypothetical protein